MTKKDIAPDAVKDTLIRVLDELPTERMVEVLDFALFLQTRQSPAWKPTDEMMRLSTQAECPLQGAVLRYDDRGVAGSSGNRAGIVLDDIAADARAAVDYLAGREEIDATRTVVCVRGVTTDNSALHRCIRGLGDSWLFTKADLESLDSTDDEAMPGAASFEIFLELLPGYGQSNGPVEGPSESIAS